MSRQLMFWNLVWDFVRFFWRRDSDSACRVLIWLSEWMSDRDLQQMADYLISLKRNRAS